MKKTTLVLMDEVNCKFLDLDPATRRALVKKLTFIPDYARHTQAYKLGRWNGEISFVTVGGSSFINLLEHLIPVVMEAGYHIEIDDKRKPFPVNFEPVDEDYLSDCVWPEDHWMAGEPIILLDHQVRAVNTYLREKQCLMEICTAAGKTIVTSVLAKKVQDAIPGGRTLTIVPSKGLVTQTEKDFKLVGLDVGVYYGDRKETDHQHIVATWQSLSRFSKKNENKKLVATADFKEFLKGIVAVVVDEAHSAKGVELKNLLSDTNGMAHVPLRWGMTGTVPDEEYDFYAILGTIGPLAGEITAKELQEKEILSNLHINILQTDDKHMKFKTYAEAHKYLVNHPDRLQWLANYCKDLQKTGNVLILFEKINTGTMLKEMIPDLVIVNGSVSLKKRQISYDSVVDDSSIILGATYGVAAVGVNVPAIHHIVLIEPGISVVRVIQSIGRGLRRTKFKLFVNLHDFCSNNHFSNKHMLNRQKKYDKAQYPYSVTQVDV
jgi:superfamily II DNA or RNA helicase